MLKVEILILFLILNIFVLQESLASVFYSNETQIKHIRWNSDHSQKSFIGSLIDHSNEKELKPPFYVVPLEPENENTFKKFINVNMETGLIYTNLILKKNQVFSFSALSISTGQVIIIKIHVVQNENSGNSSTTKASIEISNSFSFTKSTHSIKKSNHASIYPDQIKKYQASTSVIKSNQKEDQCPIINRKILGFFNLLKTGSYKCILVDSKYNYSKKTNEIKYQLVDDGTGVIFFRCEQKQSIVQLFYSTISANTYQTIINLNLNIENYNIFVNENRSEKVNVKNSTQKFKQLFISLKCRFNTNNTFIHLKLLDNEGFLVISRGYNILAIFVLNKNNESCFEHEFEREKSSNRIKSFDSYPIVVSAVNFTEKNSKNIVSGLHDNIKLFSTLLLVVLFMLTFGIILVFLFYKKRAKNNNTFEVRSLFMESNSSKKELNIEKKRNLKDSNFNVSTNTFGTRSSVISQNADSLTIRSKQSLKDEYFSEELKVNDEEVIKLNLEAESKNKFFEFSHGYLNEMVINMMEKLLNIAVNNKIMNQKSCNESLNSIKSKPSVENNLNYQLGTEIITKNDRIVYMDVEFYKWCKLLDWKLNFVDMSDVFEDLIKL